MGNITVSEFVRLCTEERVLTVRLYDNNAADEIFNGPLSDMPTNLRELQVASWDAPSESYEITINVDTSEDDE